MHDESSSAHFSQSAPPLTPTEALSREFEFDKHVNAGNAVAIAAVVDKTQSGLQLREGFRIGDLGLMIRYENGSELIELPATFALPNAPEWLSGIANLHGTLVPVFDLARYFGVEHTTGTKPMLLVLGHGADAAGVVIDGLPERLRFDSSARADDAPVPETLESCVSQTFWAGERTWMDLQVDALLNKLNDELATANQ